MEVGERDEREQILSGPDLGQRRDHSAIAVVEKVERWRPYGQGELEALLVRHVERMPLGMTYPQVVERVRAVIQTPELLGQWGLVVDATGVGAPVVEMLRAAGLRTEISAVTITGGAKQSAQTVPGGGQYNVPKQDLVAHVQLLLERKELRISREMREAGTLAEELVDVRRTTRANGRERVGAERSGEHDDLVIALALACWKAGCPVKMNQFGQARIFDLGG